MNNASVGELITLAIRQGKDDAAVIRHVLALIPNASVTTATVRWYRKQLGEAAK